MAGVKTPAKRTGASEVILVVSLELLAVGVFTVIAGINDNMADLVLLFMTGMWIIFLITDAATIGKLGEALQGLSVNPHDSAPAS